MALTAALLPQLRIRGGVVLNLSSDASVEAYETWGGYGSSKAGLDHATRVLAAEEPALRVYAVDPGDMRTQMHQDAFPGEDISDRPEPSGRRTGAAPAPGGRAAQRPLPRVRAAEGAGVRMSAAATERGSCCRPAARRPRRPRPAGSPATRSGWPWSPRSGTHHRQARELPLWLEPGDLLVVNTSATLPSALEVQRHGCTWGLHVSAELDDGAWVVELRRPDGTGPGRARAGRGAAAAGRRAAAHRGAAPGRPDPAVAGDDRCPPPTGWRTCAATGRPIRYPYLHGEWPIEDLQNVYAAVPGSAEMPSAGRPLSARGCWST